MSEVLHLILQMMAEQWKTMDEELIVYRLNQTAEMAEELKRERDEAQAAFAIATDQLVVAQSQARQWHQCAKKLAPFVVPIPADMADHTACVGALAEFERLKEDGK